MKCYIISFESLESARTVFEYFQDKRKCFLFSKQETFFVAIYCSGFKCDTLSFLVKNDCKSLKSELIPDFGYFCDLEKVTIIRMANV